jgi:hypothetical protein
MGSLTILAVGNTYLLVIGNYYTIFFYVVLMRNQDAANVTKKLIEARTTVMIPQS